jgi:invasion protein IalB
VRSFLTRTMLSLSCVLILSTGAVAQAKKPAEKAKADGKTTQALQLESNGSWSAFASQGARKVCYAMSQPKERTPKNLKRDAAFLFVSQRPADKVRSEVSFVLGFPAKEGAAAEAIVDDKSFALLTKGDKAWLRNAADDPQFVEALAEGSSLTVKAISGRGNALSDKYVLSGFKKTWDRAVKECP